MSNSEVIRNARYTSKLAAHVTAARL